MHLECLLGRLRRSLLPERVDQLVARDDPVRVQEQEADQGALLRAAELEQAAFVENLERPEDAKFDA